MRKSIWVIGLFVATFVGPTSGASQSPAVQSQVPISRDTFAVWMGRLSNTGRWGPADQLGTLNLITPEKRRAAAQSVRAGISISLASDLVAGPDSNSIAPLRFGLAFAPGGSPDSTLFGAIDTLWVIAHGWAYSHLDALAHFAYRGRMYNAVKADLLRSQGAQRLGVETMHNGIVTRGVLVDIPRLKNVPYLRAGVAVTSEDLEAWERHHRVRIEPGDVILIRTGRGARTRETGPWRVAAGTAGPHPFLAAWLKTRGVAALGSDVGNEVSPSLVEGVDGPLHFLTIVAQGMPLLDNLELETVAAEAAARSRPTFMFVAAPLRIRGGTGSLVNPLAIF